MTQPRTGNLRARQLVDLARAELRAMHLGPLAASAGLSILVVAVAIRHRAEDPSHVVPALQMVALALSLGFAFIFDDPAADSISAAPTSLLWRRVVRLTPSILSVSAVWTVALAVTSARTDGPIPMGALSLYLAAGLAFVVAIACATGKATREGPGGIAGGPLLLLIIGLSRVLPARFRFFEAEGTGYSIALRLGVVALLSAAVAVWASLDPARRRLARLRPRR